MIEWESPDLVAVWCTGPTLHGELGAAVAAAGVSMFYFENAVACSMRAGDLLPEACRKHGTSFNCGVLNWFNRRM